MGKKKGKKDKKGKGAEKTVLKTEKKADKKTKKLLQEKGEEDVEALIAEFQEKDRKRKQVIEEKCPPPSQRCNMTLTPHPDKEELIMFGGEYFNGNKTFVYQDLYVYSIRNNEWNKLTVPNAPPPRCAHQAVALKQGGGQLWVFGGEFSSPTQSQFYHYKDLWLYHLKDKMWERINAPGGPSARSGHRMASLKKLLLVFGGFHDNNRDFKYYNDLHAFNLETYTWMKLELHGIPPAPRSGCVLAVSNEPSLIIVYGGYSKEKAKRDADQGKVHTDMVMLTPEGKCKQEATPSSWKWVQMKQSGVRPSPRCSCSVVGTPGNRAVIFGGVYDQEEEEEDDDEELQGNFFNDMYSLEVDKGKWHEIILRGKKEASEKRKRRRKKEKQPEGSEAGAEGGDVSGEESEGEEDMDDEMEEEVKKLKMSEDESQKDGVEKGQADEGVFQMKMEPQSSSTLDDGIFSVTVGPQTGRLGSAAMATGDGSSTMDTEAFMPSARMNPMLAVKNGVMYLYGGIYEDGDKQYTLSDFYSLDLHKLDEWQTIIACDLKLQEWEESDSSSGDEDGDEEEDLESMEGSTSKQEVGGAVGGEEDDSESEDEESDDEMDFESTAPEVNPGESSADYFSRTQDSWLAQAEDVAAKEGLKVKPKQKLKAAQKMAEEYHTKSSANQ